MNKNFRIFFGIFFHLIISGIQVTTAQTVSATIKIDLKSFLSIAIIAEKGEQNFGVQQQNYTPIQIKSVGPCQLEVRSSDDQKLRSRITPEISNKSLTMIIAGPYSSARDQNVPENKPISKMGGIFHIGIFDIREAEKPLIISLTPL
ncbi:hypothetical protein [Sphingobacterium kitahiroshimense]|uniref:hypothetical protein n=1 Tax=Sphingobacterium kitahiroshimense TaxID=470446 RepID=UPI0032099761